MKDEIDGVEDGLTTFLSLIVVIGSDLSFSEQEEIIKKAYISSCAVKDFISGDLDLDTFLDIQGFCLSIPIDDYLSDVANNIESSDFSELLIG